jgi:ABC-type sugar transport system permease subunit
MGLEKQIRENKLMRRLVLLWAVVIITVLVVWTWLRPPNIPTGTVSALLGIIGILATVLNFYMWSRGRDDEARRIKEVGYDYFNKNHGRDYCGPYDRLRPPVLEPQQGYRGEGEAPNGVGG